MYPTRYFPDSYFAPRYWPKVGADSTEEPHVVSAFAMYRASVDGFGLYRTKAESLAMNRTAVDAFASEGEV